MPLSELPDDLVNKDPRYAHAVLHNLTGEAFNALLAEITTGRLSVEGVATQVANVLGGRNAIVNLLSRLAPADTPAVPDLAADPPTVSLQAATTITGTPQVVGPLSGAVTLIGSRPTWNSTFSRTNATGGMAGFDMFLTGDRVEVRLYTASTNQGVWVWVDGKPVTPTVTDNVVTASSTYHLTLAFATSKRRRVEVYAPGASWFDVRTPMGQLLTPAPRKPLLLAIGDSFWGGSAHAGQAESGGWYLGRLLGMEVAINAKSGTGYASAGAFEAFGDAARLAEYARFDPDLIVISGTVNDDNKVPAAVGAAATKLYADLAAQHPRSKIIVFGAQPSNAADTVSAARSANIAAVKAAALAAPNVIAFHDMIGTAGAVPPGWSSSASYDPGALVTRYGAVWRWDHGNPGNVLSPGSTARWAPMTYVYTGTGKVGTLTGDGTRDFFLGSDAVHPTPAGGLGLAQLQANDIRRDLRTFATAAA